MARKPRKDKGRRRCEIIAEEYGCEVKTWDTSKWQIASKGRGYANAPVVREWYLKGKWQLFERPYSIAAPIAVYDTRTEAREALITMRLILGMNEDGTPTETS